MRNIRDNIREEIIFIAIGKKGIWLGRTSIKPPMCTFARTQRHGAVVQYTTETISLYNFNGTPKRSIMYNIRKWLS